MVDYEVMVKKKRMAGIAIIAVGLVLGLLAYLLDLVSFGKILSSTTPLYLLLGGLMISVLGAIYIGAGTTEAVRLLNKQVKIMKAELSEKEKTIDEQKKGIENLSDNRLTGLSQTVDRLDMLEKEKAAEAAMKPPEKPTDAAQPKQAWEKNLEAKRTEKATELPPPPPKSMVVPGPAKPVAAQALPPPPPKSMQVSPLPKPHETPAPPVPIVAPKPHVAAPPPAPVPAPKPVALAPPVVEPKPASVPPIQPKPEPAPVAAPTPAAKPPVLIEEEEESDAESEEEEIDEEELLPTTTCPKCSNTFKGEWEHCPFCDYNFNAPKTEAPVAEPPKTEPAAPATAGLSILGYAPKRNAPVPTPAATPPPAPEPMKTPPPPTMERPPEPPRPVEVKPAPASIVPPLPDFSKPAQPVPHPSPALVAPQPVVPAPTVDIAKDKCPSCNKTVKPHWRNCPYCKATLK